ncbi:MAG: hypothetical protein ABGY43_01670 [bacterium]|jgi:hypothetical protein|nr:hypothetical protein [Gammaproteobacteria bacterium]HIL85272.1 hypothetical protein [Pseudomonadales bacterium]
MNNKQLDVWVYLTGILVAFSVLLPITSLPVLGEVSYHQVAEREANIVIAFCLVNPILLLLGKSRLVILPLTGVWATLLFPAIKQLLKSDEGFFSQATGQANRITQEFAADLFMNVIEFSWGGYVFLAALVGFTITCALRAFR